MTKAPLVDSHFHLFDRTLPFVDQPRHKPDYDFTAETVLETFDKYGVQYGVVAGASLYGTYNDHVIRATRAHKRLRGTLVGDPTLELYAMEKMAEDGIVGVRLVWISLSDERLPDITAYEWRRMLRRVRDLDWHVHLHVGPGRLPAILPTVIESGVKTVLDHFAYPDTRQGLNCPTFQAALHAIDNGRTWVKLSSAFRMGGREVMAPYAQKLLEVAGPERLLWGSDAPFASFENKATYQQTLDDLTYWVPDETKRAVIGGDTPLKLYFS